MTALYRSRSFVLLALAALAGCGAGGGAATAPPVAPATTTAAASAPKPLAPISSTGLSPAAAAYLNLNLNALANYANPALPAYYSGAVRASDNTPPGDPVTDRGATLGRVLFNDKRLSINGAISCATCHQQRLGFTDSARFSTGFAGVPNLTAHAPRLGNIRYYRPGTMFWNKRAASIEAQVAGPIESSIEMGYDDAHGGFGALTTAMSRSPYYPELFTFAFGDSTITQTRVASALAQFERSMITTHSRWDQGYALVYDPAAPQANLDADLPNFTAQENRGRHLFMAPPQAGGVGCASCHQPPTFALDGRSLSNGLDAGETTVFKSPSLKNDGRGPYMNDGRFATLADVIEHYNSGIQAGPALDPRLQRNGVPIRLHLSDADKAAIVAFLATLDDPAFFTDPRFSSPFLK